MPLLALCQHIINRPSVLLPPSEQVLSLSSFIGEEIEAQRNRVTRPRAEPGSSSKEEEKGQEKRTMCSAVAAW